MLIGHQREQSSLPPITTTDDGNTGRSYSPSGSSGPPGPASDGSVSRSRRVSRLSRHVGLFHSGFDQHNPVGGEAGMETEASRSPVIPISVPL